MPTATLTTMPDRASSWDGFADACLTHDQGTTSEQRILDLLMRADRDRQAS